MSLTQITQAGQRHLLAIVVVLGVIAASSLVVGEIFARQVLGLGTPPLYASHPVIEYHMAPNQDVMRFHTRQLVNQWGMRSEAVTKRKADESELRIVVVGDSVLNGSSLTDHDDLATTMVEDWLNETIDQPVRVLNVSAGSWGPGNWRGYAETHGFFDADLVLLLCHGSDAGDNPTFRPLDRRTHPTEAPPSALVEGFDRYFLGRYVLPLFRESVPLAPLNEPGKTEQGLSDLDEFFALARASGAKVGLIKHVERAELAGDAEIAGSELIHDFASQRGIRVTHLADTLEVYGDGVWRDNIHLSAFGQLALAETIVDATFDAGLAALDTLPTERYASGFRREMRLAIAGIQPTIVRTSTEPTKDAPDREPEDGAPVRREDAMLGFADLRERARGVRG
ncbi:MAG: hypothetical protein AAGB51_02540 [Planctomycetota bacterium]